MNAKLMTYITILLSCKLHVAAPQKEILPYALLLNLTVEPVQYISFDPDEALRNRANFEKKYGIKGEKLIESFGSSPETSSEILVIEDRKKKPNKTVDTKVSR